MTQWLFHHKKKVRFAKLGLSLDWLVAPPSADFLFRNSFCLARSNMELLTSEDIVCAMMHCAVQMLELSHALHNQHQLVRHLNP